MIITVNVTAKDILFGEPNSCTFCPIARALKREIKNTRSLVYGDRVWFGFIQSTYTSLPKQARKFIDDFDTGASVKPFKFKMNVPKEVVKGRK